MYLCIRIFHKTRNEFWWEHKNKLVEWLSAYSLRLNHTPRANKKISEIIQCLSVAAISSGSRRSLRSQSYREAASINSIQGFSIKNENESYLELDYQKAHFSIHLFAYLLINCIQLIFDATRLLSTFYYFSYYPIPLYRSQYIFKWK